MERVIDTATYIIKHLYKARYITASEYETLAVAVNRLDKYEKEHDKLMEYQNAESEGRLVILPFKKGTTLWRIVRDATPHVTKDCVCEIALDDDMRVITRLGGGRILSADDIGKTVFSTREDAEKALSNSFQAVSIEKGGNNYAAD